MSWEKCPSATPGCRLYYTEEKVEGAGSGCFQDEHHLYPRSTWESRIHKRFGMLACNTVQICRVEHDELHAKQAVSDFEIAYPPIDVMKSIIQQGGFYGENSMER